MEKIFEKKFTLHIIPELKITFKQINQIEYFILIYDVPYYVMGYGYWCVNDVPYYVMGVKGLTPSHPA